MELNASAPGQNGPAARTSDAPFRSKVATSSAKGYGRDPSFHDSSFKLAGK